MSHAENNRVLGRLGARELTAEEVERVSGGVVTHILTRNPIADHGTDG